MNCIKSYNTAHQTTSSSRTYLHVGHNEYTMWAKNYKQTSIALFVVISFLNNRDIAKRYMLAIVCNSSYWCDCVKVHKRTDHCGSMEYSLNGGVWFILNSWICFIGFLLNRIFLNHIFSALAKIIKRKIVSVCCFYKKEILPGMKASLVFLIIYNIIINSATNVHMPSILRVV